MGGSTYKLSADVDSFNKGLLSAQNSVKTLDAQLKMNEKQLKATGDAELYASNKSQILNKQLDAQRTVVSGIQKSLQEMKDNGVDPTSEAYQKLEKALYTANGKMFDIQSQLQELTSSEQEAGKGADALAQNLTNISKKVSFDAVITGIGKITGGLESAAKKTIQLGQAIFDEIVDAARWADDSATMAQMYEIPLERYLQMQALVANGMDTSVDAIVGSMQKLKKNVGKESSETMATLRQLGLVGTQIIDTGFHKVEQEVKLYSDADDLFWKAGKAIMNMSDAFDKEAAAQAVFGKSWRELIPLFTEFESKESFNEALEQTTTVSEDAVTKLAELSDRLGELEGAWNSAKIQLLSSLAPALESAAKALADLLNGITEYLKTDEGQEKLKKMEEAVSGLFDDLGKIDPEQVVKGFTDVFNAIVGGLQWMVENEDTLKGILGGVVIAWGALELTGGALQVLQLVNGIKGLTASSAAAAGATAGASWAGAFASAAMAAAPFLAFLYTTLNPAETGSNDMYNGTTGNLTGEGWADYYDKARDYYERGEMSDWGRVLLEVGDMFGNMSVIRNDTNAINAMNRYRLSGMENIDQLIAEMAGLGYTPYDDWETARERSREFFRQKYDIDTGAGTDEDVPEIPELKVDELKVPDDAAAQIQVQVGTVQVPVELVFGKGLFGVPQIVSQEAGHANGLSYVPYDGYLARLHKGERVLPAREVGSRSFSSNLYVENMNMGSGMDADALAAAIAGRNRRMMAGYGS